MRITRVARRSQARLGMVTMLIHATAFVAGCDGQLSADSSRIVELRQRIDSWGQSCSPPQQLAEHGRFDVVTSEEVRDRLGGSIVRYAEFAHGGFGARSFLVTADKVIPLGCDLPVALVDDSCTADLDSDAVAEFVYTFHWGSGVAGSGLAMHCEACSDKTVRTPLAVTTSGSLSLAKADDQSIAVLYDAHDKTRMPDGSITVGRLRAASQEGKLDVVIDPDPDLPERVRREVQLGE